MEEKCVFSIESLAFKGLQMNGINIQAEHTANAAEIESEASAACQVIDGVANKFSWLKPYLERLAASAATSAEAYSDAEKSLKANEKKLADELTNQTLNAIRRNAQQKGDFTEDDLRKAAKCVLDLLRTSHPRDLDKLGEKLTGRKPNANNNPRSDNNPCNGNTGCQYCKKGGQ